MRPTDPECVFCKIVRGEIPAQVVYRDENFIAFLDINPISPGHTLVVPTAHVETLAASPQEWLAGLSGILPTLSRAVMTAAGADGMNLLNNIGRSAGQVVEHVHFHLIPRRSGDGVGLVNWRPGEASPEELAAMKKGIEGTLSREG